MTTLNTLLDDYHYNIEFHGYLSNHAKHAILALYGLQAPSQRLQEYWNSYTAVTPYGLSLQPSEPLKDVPKDIQTDGEWAALLGKKQSFSALCKFFCDKVQRLGMQAVLRRYAPKLLEGLAGALTHGVIHLGWGLPYSQWMSIEGLAYMTFAYLSAHPERFHMRVEGSETHPSDSPIQNPALCSLLWVAGVWEAQDLAQRWIAQTKAKYTEESGFHAELVVAGFQWELSKVLEDGHDLLYSLPVWWDLLDVAALLHILYETAVVLYLGTVKDEHGDFLVLHLITSLWGLENVLEAASLPVHQQKVALQCYWVTLLAAVSTRSSGWPRCDHLQSSAMKFQNQFDDADAVQNEWDEIIARAISQTEEHNMKLVFVTRELWRRYDHWAAFRAAAATFTATPNIGPSQVVFNA